MSAARASEERADGGGGGVRRARRTSDVRRRVPLGVVQVQAAAARRAAEPAGANPESERMVLVMVNGAYTYISPFGGDRRGQSFLTSFCVSF